MDRVERYTYHQHIRAAVAEGLFMGIMWSAADIAKKNQGAGTLIVTLVH